MSQTTVPNDDLAPEVPVTMLQDIPATPPDELQDDDVQETEP